VPTWTISRLRPQTVGRHDQLGTQATRAKTEFKVLVVSDATDDILANISNKITDNPLAETRTHYSEPSNDSSVRTELLQFNTVAN
jgi:hypothetical protein